MDDLHRRLARVAFGAGDDLGLVLAGGYALGAHELTSRPSRDVDLATASPLPLSVIVPRLEVAYRAEGYAVTVIECTPRMARLEVADDTDVCEIDLLKEAIGPPAMLSVGPVLSWDDAVGLKVRALHDRAAHRDFIDVHAAAAYRSREELEGLGRRHTPHFALSELADRLSVAADRDDRGFLYYGLDHAALAELRTWAQAWETDIRARIAAGGGDGPLTGPDWDTYLDEL